MVNSNVNYLILPTTFAEASTSAKATVDKSVVRMWKCCQFQCCQWPIRLHQGYGGQVGNWNWILATLVTISHSQGPGIAAAWGQAALPISRIRPETLLGGRESGIGLMLPMWKCCQSQCCQ